MAGGVLSGIGLRTGMIVQRRWHARQLVFALMAAACLLAGLWKLGGIGVMLGKAWLAPALLERALDASQGAGQPIRAWFWSDARVVGAVSLGQGQHQMPVLGDGRQRAMAFAPVTWMEGAARILVAHRDTHFEGLENVESGDLITYQSVGGETRRYFVQRIWTADKDALHVPDAGLAEGLLLITCYPFDAPRAGGRQRYLVWAVPV